MKRVTLFDTCCKAFCQKQQRKKNTPLRFMPRRINFPETARPNDYHTAFSNHRFQKSAPYPADNFMFEISRKADAITHVHCYSHSCAPPQNGSFGLACAGIIRKKKSARKKSWRFGSSGKTRTYNPSVNSRMLCH